MKSGSTRHVALSGIASGQLIIVAMDGARLLGVLFTLETARALAPPVRAMLAAWPGSADAYVYGPVCIDEAARGKGVLEALHADLVKRGAKVLKAPANYDYGLRDFDVADLDGNMLFFGMETPKT